MTGDGTSSSRQAGASTAAGSWLTYDAAGPTATSTDLAGRTTTFTYLQDGRVATTTDPSGTVTTNRYDDLTGRLLSVEGGAEERLGADPERHLRAGGPAGRRGGC